MGEHFGRPLVKFQSDFFLKSLVRKETKFKISLYFLICTLFLTRFLAFISFYILIEVCNNLLGHFFHAST